MTDDARERLEMELEDCNERILGYEKDIRRCLDRDLSWRHPTVVTHRSRLAVALAERAMLERLLGRGGR
jgi:hypothetical protein